MLCCSVPASICCGTIPHALRCASNSKLRYSSPHRLSMPADMLQMYLNFLMLHACFTPIALRFVYTSWHFYAFYGTNLLTRCHNASSYFLLFLCFRKVTQEIFSELDETKANVPIYLTQRRSPEERWRAAIRRPHHRVGRSTPWPCHQVVWAPGPPSDIALPHINSLHRENPRGPNTFPQNMLQAAAIADPKIGRVQKLLPTPCLRGESLPEAFFITMPASEVMCE
jgi:hypothetical protein